MAIITSQPIHIVGAGPAGLSAAIALSNAGREVHVHERYAGPGRRFQGDLQGLENWTTDSDVLNELNGMGIKTDFHTTPFYEVAMTDGKNIFTRQSKEPLFYLVKRGNFENSLDHSLHQQAIQKGVHIHYKSKMPLSHADIVATGPIRKAIIAMDKGIVFPTQLPNMALAIFDDSFAFLGYSYLLVADGYGCLCTVVFNDLTRLNACFEQTMQLAQKMFPLNLSDAKPVGGIGSFSLHHPKQLGKTLLVGEAAGMQDLLWGFGIRTALTSGYLAAKSILSQQDYSKLIHDTFDGQFKASIVNRYFWEKIKLCSRPLLPWMTKIPISLRGHFKGLYRFTPIHRLFYPLALKYVKKRYPNSIDFEESIDFFNKENLHAV